MLPPAAATLLSRRGHDAASVHDVGLAGASDPDVFDFAVENRRLVVTENFSDYALLLAHRLGNDQPCVPVVFVRKPDLPKGGALAARLAERLDAWAAANPEPYLGPH